MVALRVVVVGVGVEVSPGLVAKMHENRVQMSCVCWSRQARIFGVCGPGLVGAATAEGAQWSSHHQSPKENCQLAVDAFTPTVAGPVNLGMGPDQTPRVGFRASHCRRRKRGAKRKKSCVDSYDTKDRATTLDAADATILMAYPLSLHPSS